MTNQEVLELEGIVLEVLVGGMYRVRLNDMDLEVTAYAAGKMKKFNIKIIPGDLVTVQLNTYEPTKGRIVFRKINNKDNRGPAKPPTPKKEEPPAIEESTENIPDAE